MHMRPRVLLTGFFWVNWAMLIWALLLGLIESGTLTATAATCFFICAAIATAYTDRSE